jgi:hypothetical protein
VGAPGNGGSGAAYVYTFNGAFWALQKKLIPNDNAAGDNFGKSVAISGDTVVAGAPFDDISANVDQGSAYVFTRSLTPSGAIWTQQQKLTASDGEAGENFGDAVAVSGDTVVVGLAFDAIGANTFQGSAYVFTRVGGVWALQQKLTASDGAAGDRFGHSVAISGDTLVAGADLDTIDANADQGSAYIFTRSGSTWTQQQKLTANNGLPLDFLGTSVAIDANTVVVGAVGNDFGANLNQGSAYVFVSSACPTGALSVDGQ